MSAVRGIIRRLGASLPVGGGWVLFHPDRSSSPRTNCRSPSSLSCISQRVNRCQWLSKSCRVKFALARMELRSCLLEVCGSEIQLPTSNDGAEADGPGEQPNPDSLFARKPMSLVTIIAESKNSRVCRKERACLQLPGCAVLIGG